MDYIERIYDALILLNCFAIVIIMLLFGILGHVKNRD